MTAFRRQPTGGYGSYPEWKLLLFAVLFYGHNLAPQLVHFTESALVATSSDGHG
jgi:hypothetical protein